MKLLVSDYDGTLFTDERSMKINVKRIEAFVKEGNLFMLSSGRSFESLMGKVEEHNIPISYLATEDGSHLFDKNGTLLHEELMDLDIEDEIHGLKALNRHYGMQYGTTRKYYESYPGLPVSSINFILNEDMINRQFNREWKRLEKAHKDRYEFLVYGYDSIYYYCIKPKGIDKAKPVDKLSEILELNKSSIFTIGDGDNDMPMIVKYNGYMIGDNEPLKKCSLKCYNEVYELIDDIEKQKVIRRW